MVQNDCPDRTGYFLARLQRRPDAIARIRGSGDYPELRGRVRFYQTELGVLTAAEVCGLPIPGEACGGAVFAIHIHSGETCSGNPEDPFADAMTHYDPEDCPHPAHAGDLPPLFGNQGYALEIFLTDRFAVGEIIGRTVIIHRNADDFTTQPAGAAGEKIACGVIERFPRF